MSISDQSFSPESSESEFEIGGSHTSKTPKNPNYEKNYTKNILMPIINSLDIKGYQNIYKSQKIFPKEIQKRNSASLLHLYKILTHPLMNQISIPQCEILASNILLQNPKVSKKIFHLQRIRDFFSFDRNASLVEFKSEMKKKARKNIQKEAVNIQIFQWQSSTIYLLAMFCKTIEDNPNLSEQSMENKESTQQQNNTIQKCHDRRNNTKKQSRDILNQFLNMLHSKLNRQRWSKQKFENVYDAMRSLILESEQKMIQKLNFKPGIPYIRLFCPEVISKCFQLLRDGKKVKFGDLKQIIKMYEKQSLDKIARSFQQIKKPIEYLNVEQNQKTDSKMVGRASRLSKKFCPIIITRPC